MNQDPLFLGSLVRHSSTTEMFRGAESQWWIGRSPRSFWEALILAIAMGGSPLEALVSLTSGPTGARRISGQHIDGSTLNSNVAPLDAITLCRKSPSKQLFLCMDNSRLSRLEEVLKNMVHIKVVLEDRSMAHRTSATGMTQGYGRHERGCFWPKYHGNKARLSFSKTPGFSHFGFYKVMKGGLVDNYSVIVLEVQVVLGEHAFDA